MYTIEFNKAARLLTLRPSGFWDVKTTFKYLEEVSSTLERLRQRGERFDILSDNRDFPVQSADVIKAFGDAAQLSRQFEGRVAIVSSGALAKMQKERITALGRVRTFFAEEEARQWLADDNDPEA